MSVLQIASLSAEIYFDPSSCHISMPVSAIESSAVRSYFGF
jgi:hypothetical protein